MVGAARRDARGAPLLLLLLGSGETRACSPRSRLPRGLGRRDPVARRCSLLLRQRGCRRATASCSSSPWPALGRSVAALLESPPGRARGAATLRIRPAGRAAAVELDGPRPRLLGGPARFPDECQDPRHGGRHFPRQVGALVWALSGAVTRSTIRLPPRFDGAEIAADPEELAVCASCPWEMNVRAWLGRGCGGGGSMLMWGPSHGPGSSGSRPARYRPLQLKRGLSFRRSWRGGIYYQLRREVSG